MEPILLKWKKVHATWLTRKPSPSSFWVAAYGTFFLLVINLYYWKYQQGPEDLWVASGEKIFAQGEWWRLWSATLVHSDGAHFSANAFLFFILSYFLYGYFGWWVFPVLVFLCAGLTNFLAILSYAPEVRLLGASGAIYVMGGLWLVLYLMIDKQKSRAQRSLRAFGVALGIFMPTSAFEPAVSYRTHLLGFAVGLLAGFIYYFVKRRTFLAALVEETVVEEATEVPR